MKKPRLFKGLAYSVPESGLVAFYVPNSDFGAKLIVLKVTPQTMPVIVLLRHLVDEATKPAWYQRLWRKYKKPVPSAELINAKLGNEPKPTVPVQGRVTKVKGKAEYTPDLKPGGRVVRGMPKQIKKMKEAQEAKPDDLPTL